MASIQEEDEDELHRARDRAARERGLEVGPHLGDGRARDGDAAAADLADVRDRGDVLAVLRPLEEARGELLEGDRAELGHLRVGGLLERL